MENNTIQDAIHFFGQMSQIAGNVMLGQPLWIGLEERPLTDEENAGNEENAMVNIPEQTALLLRDLSESDDEQLNELLLARLCVLQEESNRLLSVSAIRGEGGVGGSTADSFGQFASWLTVEEVFSGGFLVGKAHQFWDKAIETLPKLGPLVISTASAVLQAGKGLLASVGQGIVQAGEASLTAGTAMLMPGLGMQVAAALGFPAFYVWASYMTKDDPEIQELNRRLNEGELTEQDFIDRFYDTPLGRSEWLGYLAGIDEKRYGLERILSDESISFSEADRRRIRRRGDDPKYDLAYGGTSTIVKTEEGYVKKIRPEVRAAVNDAAGRDVFIPGGEAASNRALYHAEDVSNPQTGAWEGEGQVSPYQLENPRGSTALLEFTSGTAGNDSLNLLAEALGKVADAYALPRVTVGSLANTLVVREEADIDRIAAELARRLNETQMVS